MHIRMCCPGDLHHLQFGGCEKFSSDPGRPDSRSRSSVRVSIHPLRITVLKLILPDPQGDGLTDVSNRDTGFRPCSTRGHAGASCDLRQQVKSQFRGRGSIIHAAFPMAAARQFNAGFLDKLLAMVRDQPGQSYRSSDLQGHQRSGRGTPISPSTDTPQARATATACFVLAIFSSSGRAGAVIHDRRETHSAGSAADLHPPKGHGPGECPQE